MNVSSAPPPGLITQKPPAPDRAPGAAMLSSTAISSSELLREALEGPQPTAEELLAARRAESVPPPGTGEWLDITA